MRRIRDAIQEFILPRQLTPLLNAFQKYFLCAVVYGFFRLALAFFSVVEISLHSLGFGASGCSASFTQSRG
jgi:hypothetical protein